jgi:hypothetical protein
MIDWDIPTFGYPTTERNLMLNNDTSSVARIKQQIEAEQESAYRALYSSAYGTAQHKFITRRLERMGELHEELKGLVGEQDSNAFLVGAMGKDEEVVQTRYEH